MKTIFTTVILSYFFIFQVSGQVPETNVFTINTWNTPDACSGSSGTAWVMAYGGIPPYTYLWNDGSTNDSLSMIPAGTYYVTVTDSTGAFIQDTITIQNSNSLDGPSTTFGTSYGFNNDGFRWMTMSNGLPPFTMTWCDGVISPQDFDHSLGRYDLSGTSTSGTCNLTPSGVYHTVTITDAVGCTVSTGTSFATRAKGYVMPTPYVHGACSGLSNGYITDTLEFSDPAFLVNGQPYQWRNDFFTTRVTVIDLATQTPVIFKDMNHSIGYHYNLQNLPAGNYHLKYDLWTGVFENFRNVFVAIPDLGINCGTVSGIVYVDQDQNCQYNGTDIREKHSVITIQPGNINAVTNSYGFYSVSLPDGNYTVSHTPAFGAPLITTCVSQPVPFTIDSINPSVTVDFADEGTGVDLVADISVTEMHPGFNSVITATAINASANISSNDSLVIIYDPVLTVNSYSTAPDYAAPGYASWFIQSLLPLGSKSYTMDVSLPPDPGLLGTIVTTSATIVHTVADLNSGNDHDSVTTVITGSYDPNVKHVSPSGYSQDNLIPLNWPHYDYTVEFQNTGNDTAMHVYITDTLDSSLDLTSIVILSSSHPYEFEILTGRVLKFSFYNIMLPDSGINQEGSKGYINFRLSPVTGLAEGTVINNSANIYFDFNPPIITNTTSLTLYDCDNISGLIPSTMLMCEGDDLLMIANSIVPADVNWYYDNNFMVTSDTLQIPNLQTGIHDIILESVTPYCTQNQLHQANVNPLPAVIISVDADTLEAITSGFIYQWYLNGTIINGATSQQYVAQQSGNYSVEVTDFQGCSNLSSQVYVSLTGIAESNENQFLLSPNPGSDYVNIESGNTEEINLTVTDINGKIILFNTTWSAHVKIDTKNWPKGMYVFHCIKRKETVRLRWIK